MAIKIDIDLEKFDFNYWNNNRIAVLRKLIELQEVENVKTLADRIGLNYASTYNIVMNFKKQGLVTRQGRVTKLASDWENIFISARK